MPEGSHPMPVLAERKGWQSLPFVDLDGQNWPLSVAAKVLDVPEDDLRHLVRITGLEPAGVMRM